MKLQTRVEIAPLSGVIDYTSRVFTIGSCFANSVGCEMSRAKLRVVMNPTGVLFNPISVCDMLDRLGECRLIEPEELIEGRGAEPAWYHFDMHSSLSRSTREESCEAINRAIESGSRALMQADWVVITLGTTWVYELVDGGNTVANCHKRPARDFHRRRLSVSEVVEALDRAIMGVLKGRNVILTVSPIRHVGDGLVESSLSKAALRVAVEELAQRYDWVNYFPAYEIVMDELRDYRFYDRDLVHVTPLAVEYIWERFAQVALSQRAQELLPQVMQVVRGVEHRPINVESEQHKKFLQSLLRQIDALREVEFGEEIGKIEENLKINL